MTLDATIVIPGIFAVTYAAWGLLSAAAALTRKLNGRIERRYWRTIERNTCPICKRVENKRERSFDPDLGFYFDNTFENCTACDYASGKTIEFDLSTCSVDDIRALDREHTINSGAM